MAIITGNDATNDVLNGTAGPDVISGLGGDDFLFGEGDEDELYGGPGDDLLNGGFGVDYLDGGPGIDGVDYRFYNGDTQVDLNKGRTTFTAFPGQVETLVSIELAVMGDGNDTLIGNNKINILLGGGGNDTIKGGGKTDHLAGEDGNDVLRGGSGKDVLEGGEYLGGFLGQDTTLGGNDKLLGGSGNDVLYGQNGNDLLNGGAGKDFLVGGPGSDSFQFKSLNGIKHDKISDFNSAQHDLIDLEKVDANVNKGGDQDFKWIGKKKFHDKAGELHYIKKGNGVGIQGDVDGDGKHDFHINLTSVSSLSKGDFDL